MSGFFSGRLMVLVAFLLRSTNVYLKVCVVIWITADAKLGRLCHGCVLINKASIVFCVTPPDNQWGQSVGLFLERKTRVFSTVEDGAQFRTGFHTSAALLQRRNNGK